MSPFLVAVAAFIAASGLVLFGFLLVQAAPDFPRARVRRRMGAIEGRTVTGNASQRLVKDSTYSEIPWLHTLLERTRFVPHLDLLLARAHLDMTAGLFLLSSAALGMLSAVAMLVVEQPLGLALLVGAGLGALPYIYLRIRARRRLRRFLEQMPDALDTMSQGLQAGLGLGQAQMFLVKQASDPIGTEFGIFAEQLNLGLPMRDALDEFQMRIPLHEMRLFSTAMLVNRDVGGALSEVLRNLADVIRDRFRIEREIKTLTAQNRMAAWVVCSMPPLIALFTYSMDPEMMQEVWLNPIGKTMFILAAGFWVLGIVAFNRLLKLHI